MRETVGEEGFFQYILRSSRVQNLCHKKVEAPCKRERIFSYCFTYRTYVISAD